MRLGIFGGSFDPVHYGHLLLAESCRDQLALDAVWFVPAAVAPHKQSQVPASAEQRVEMLRLAIGGQSSFDVCDMELKRGGVSYTVDTLRQLAAQAPDRELLLLLGWDSLAELSQWREAAAICQLALPVTIQAPEDAPPDYEPLASIASTARIEQIRRCRVIMPRVEIRSSDIRNRVAAGRSIRYLTPRAVEEYIKTAGLYRDV